MKKLLFYLLTGAFLPPVCLNAQFMKDYRPAGSPLVTSTVNLVSVTEANAAANGRSRSVNSIQESVTTASNDVWVNAVDTFGNVTFSRRYGLAGTDETASALVRCPNGDFIYAATTSFGGIRSSWLFRRGVINWSFRYFSPTSNVRSYCIKKTNETTENYIVAATIDTDRSLLVFKINAGGGMLWNRRYVDPAPPPGLTDIPKSMIIKQDTVIIAGNRTFNNTVGALVRDLFVISVHQATGNIAHSYRIIDNTGRDDINPFINFGNGGEYVLTYQTTVNFGGVNTGRIAFTRLNTLLLLAVANSTIIWEANTLNSFGHSIYRSIAAAGGYDIGGGTTVGNLHNPLFISVTNTGVPIAGTYRRLWTTLDFSSTFMMQDAFIANNRYEHHNFKRAAAQNSMSLLRHNTLGAPCNSPQPVNFTLVGATLTFRTYTAAAAITQTIYNVPDTAVHGTIPACNSVIVGVFKTNLSAGVAETQSADAAFKVYPTLLHSGAAIQVQLKSADAGATGIRVYNMQAQTVYQRQQATTAGINRFTINTSGFKPGTYIVEVQQGAIISRNKIVVE